MFAELGARTISADTLVHALYERADVKPVLRERFGDGIFDSDGGTDRRALARLVADDENGLGALEALVHPHVMQELRVFVTGGPPGSVNVCEVPLLFEGGLQGIFDLVVTIEAPLEVRRGRASGRLAPEVFDCLDARLAGEEARSGAADMTYVNTGSLADLAAFVAGIFEQARMLTTARS
jgi:dephospho-CoA kinase